MMRWSTAPSGARRLAKCGAGAGPRWTATRAKVSSLRVLCTRRNKREAGALVCLSSRTMRKNFALVQTSSDLSCFGRSDFAERQRALQRAAARGRGGPGARRFPAAAQETEPRALLDNTWGFCRADTSKVKATAGLQHFHLLRSIRDCDGAHSLSSQAPCSAACARRGLPSAAPLRRGGRRRGFRAALWALPSRRGRGGSPTAGPGRRRLGQPPRLPASVHHP